MTASPRIAHYESMTSTRRCVDCAAGIPDDVRGVRCPEHKEAARLRQLEYRHARGGRDKETSSQSERRARYRAAGLCTMCGCERDDAFVNCSHCRSESRRRAKSVTSATVVLGGRMPTMRAAARATASAPVHLASVAIPTRAPTRPRPAAPVRHKILSPSLLAPPPGWTLEEDLREEFLALSELHTSFKSLPVGDA